MAEGEELASNLLHVRPPQLAASFIALPTAKKRRQHRGELGPSFHRMPGAADIRSPVAKPPSPKSVPTSDATLSSLGRIPCAGVLQFPVLVQRHQVSFQLGRVVHFRMS